MSGSTGPSAAITWPVLTGTTGTAGAIARWLNKSTLSSGAGGDADLILQESLSWIFTRLRHWKMLTPPISATMLVGADQVTIPADLLEIDFIMIAGIVGGALYQQELVQKTPADIYRCWTYDGNGNRIQQQPKLYSFNDTFIQFDSQPDLAYPYVYTYYQFPQPLGSNNQTNFLTLFYPRLLRCVCMMFGAEFTKENFQGQFDRTYWESEAMKELMEVQAQSDRARRSAVIAPRFTGDVPGYAPWGAEVGW